MKTSFPFSIFRSALAFFSFYFKSRPHRPRFSCFKTELPEPDRFPVCLDLAIRF